MHCVALWITELHIFVWNDGFTSTKSTDISASDRRIYIYIHSTWQIFERFHGVKYGNWYIYIVLICSLHCRGPFASFTIILNGTFIRMTLNALRLFILIALILVVCLNKSLYTNSTQVCCCTQNTAFNSFLYHHFGFGFITLRAHYMRYENRCSFLLLLLLLIRSLAKGDLSDLSKRSKFSWFKCTRS